MNLSKCLSAVMILGFDVLVSRRIFFFATAGGSLFMHKASGEFL